METLHRIEDAAAKVKARARNEVVPPPHAGSPELAKLWFEIEAGPWRALLVVPATPGLSVGDAAAGLTEVAFRASADAPTLIDARGLKPDDVPARIAELETLFDRGGRAIIAIDSPLERPAAQALARRCDAAILCVELGTTALDSARRTMDACGRERFLGAVVVKGGQR